MKKLLLILIVSILFLCGYLYISPKTLDYYNKVVKYCEVWIDRFSNNPHHYETLSRKEEVQLFMALGNS